MNTAVIARGRKFDRAFLADSSVFSAELPENFCSLIEDEFKQLTGLILVTWTGEVHGPTERVYNPVNNTDHDEPKDLPADLDLEAAAVEARDSVAKKLGLI